MPCRIIDGKAIAAEINRETAAWIASAGVRPCLAVVLVGDDPASAVYVRTKARVCGELGLASIRRDLPATATTEDVLAAVRELNADPAVDGILVQSPPPPQVDERRVIEAVDPGKDVDCFHPANAGRLAEADAAFLEPCTPAGVVELLLRSGVQTAGRHAVVVGRSGIVGRPLSILLSRKGPGGDATVTLCHSRTADLGAHCLRADILVAAVGKPGLIRGDMVKEGAVVVDVGVNRVPDAAAPKGFRLAGDVDFEGACRRASAITPVPGGVGPMTIAMLMRNTVRACRRRRGLA